MLRERAFCKGPPVRMGCVTYRDSPVSPCLCHSQTETLQTPGVCLSSEPLTPLIHHHKMRVVDHTLCKLPFPSPRSGSGLSGHRQTAGLTGP